MNKTIQLAGQTVGRGLRNYIIAEIGSNHNRDFKEAEKLIDVAKEAGCDAVKFQSYTADGIYSKYTPRISEMDGRSNEGETPYELIKRIEMPLDWHRPLKDYCDKVSITFCSTPFDESMVDILEEVEVPFYKVSSYEITHYPMLAKIAQTGKPIIISTGNSDLDDVKLAVKTIEENGCRDYALLHCVSQYPAKYEDMNLKCIKTMQDQFDCPIGLSDHTLDSLSVSVAVAFGCCIIEKHITFDKKFFGPDHPFALEPDELKEMVQTVRNVELALGSGEKKVRVSEEENHRIGRRSIIAATPLKAGDIIKENNVVVKRPALGIHPKYLNEVIGKKVIKDVQCDHWIAWENLSEA